MSGNAFIRTKSMPQVFGPPARSRLDLMGIRFVEGEGGGGAGGEGNQDKPITFATQAELDRVIVDRVNRAKEPFKDFDAIKEKAEKFDKLSEANLSDAEKTTEKLTSLENRATTAEAKVPDLERQLLTYQVAAAKKLDLVHAPRLQGATKEEIEKDADTFIASLGGTTVGGKKIDPGQGGRDEETPGSKGKSEAARRFGDKAQKQ